MQKVIVEKDLEKARILCEEIIGESYHSIERMGGLTNHTYHVTMKNGREYVVRIPGDGTEELIVRADERSVPDWHAIWILMQNVYILEMMAQK